MKRASVQADFGGGSARGESKWGPVAKVVGIGCLVIFLIGAIFAGFGAFRAASCCSEIADFATQAEVAREVGYEFSLALHEQDVDRAYQLLTPERRDEVSAEEFREEMGRWSAHFQVGQPLPMEVFFEEGRDLKSLRQEGRWELQTRFMPQEGGEGVLLQLSTYSRSLEDGQIEIGIGKWSAVSETRRLEEDRYAQRGRRFVELLIQRRADEAGQMVAVASPLGDQGVEALERRAEEFYAQMGQGDPVEVAGVAALDGDRVRVLVRQQGEQGEKRVEVGVSSRFRVFDVSEIEEVEAVAREPGDLEPGEQEAEDTDEGVGEESILEGEEEQGTSEE